MLRAVVEVHQQTGMMPTVRQIGGRVGLFSPGTVHHHLARLESAGLIERRSRGEHAYRVTALGHAVLGVTVITA